MTWRAIIFAVLLCACRHESTGPRPLTGTGAPTASSEPGSDTAIGTARSADEILHARLVRAVMDLEDTLAAREPEAWGMVGLLNAGSDAPQVRPLATSVSGRLPPEVIQRIVRQNYGRLRLCYEKGLTKKKDLAGKVVTKFVIAKDGSVSHAKSTGDLPDPSVLRCVEQAFAGLKYPEPDGGIVTVTYPIVFSQDDAGPSAASSTPPPAAVPSPPPVEPEPAPSVPTPPEGPWPIVVIDGESIRMGDKIVGSTRSILGVGRLQKVDGVYDAMKAAREKWKNEHPGARFPGAAGLRAPLDTPMIVLKSVFQTMAYAGFPNLLLQVASEPSHIIDLSAIIPGPPDATAGNAPREPSRVLHVYFETDAVKLVWKRGSTIQSDERTTASELADAICKAWNANGSHRDVSDPLLDRLVVHGDNQRPFHVLADVSRAVEACTRARRDRSGTERRVPTFWMSLSVI